MYRKILVPLDGSELAEEALPIAVNLAKAGGARLVLVRVVREHVAPGTSLGEAIYETWNEAEAYLAGIAGQVAAEGLPVEHCTKYGTALEGILAAIDFYQADLVVMCTHGRSALPHVLFGFVAVEVLRRSPVPVVLVRTGAAESSRDRGLDQGRIPAPAVASDGQSAEAK